MSLNFFLFIALAFTTIACSHQTRNPASTNSPTVEGPELLQECPNVWDCKIAPMAKIEGLHRSFNSNTEEYREAMLSYPIGEQEANARSVEKLKDEIKNPKNSPQSSLLLKQLYDFLNNEIQDQAQMIENEISIQNQKLLSEHNASFEELITIGNEYLNAASHSSKPEMVQAYRTNLIYKYRDSIEKLLVTAKYITDKIKPKNNNGNYFGTKVETFLKSQSPSLKDCQLHLQFNPFKHSRSLLFLVAHEVNGIRIPLKYSCPVRTSGGKARSNYDKRNHSLVEETRIYRKKPWDGANYYNVYEFGGDTNKAVGFNFEEYWFKEN